MLLKLHSYEYIRFFRLCSNNNKDSERKDTETIKVTIQFNVLPYMYLLLHHLIKTRITEQSRLPTQLIWNSSQNFELHNIMTYKIS